MNKINTRNIGNKSYLFCRIPGHRQSLADIYSPATLASPKASGSNANTNKSFIPLAGRNLHFPWTSPSGTTSALYLWADLGGGHRHMVLCDIHLS